MREDWKKALHKAIILAAMPFLPWQLQAQDSVTRQYPFLRYDLNVISMPGDSAVFMGFIEKLKEHAMKTTHPMNIVHIGGSHIQADQWTGRARENFNFWLKQDTTTRGAFFPYKAVKSNGNAQFEIGFNKPWEGFRNVKLTAPDSLGMMGWKATATDSGQYISVRLKGDAIARLLFNRLRVFYPNKAEQFLMTITVGDSSYMPAYSDSCNCAEFSFPDLKDSFTLMVHRTDSQQKSFELLGFQTILDKPVLTYHSIGVNGASTSSYLNCLLFAKQMGLLKPDLVIFSIGINDSFDKNFSQQKFEENYRELMRRILEYHPETVFLLVTNTDSYRKVKRNIYKNANGLKVQESMYRLAKEQNAAVWDLFEVMGGLGSIMTWKNTGLATRDLVHLSKSGYYLVGDLMIDALMNLTDSKQMP